MAELLSNEALRKRLRAGSRDAARRRGSFVGTSGRSEIEPTPMSLVKTKSGVAAVPERPLPPLTDQIVRTTLERLRR